ncbi:ethylene receptor 3-like [Wolffia australiana]
MSRTLLRWLTIWSLTGAAIAGGLDSCDCDGEGFWSPVRIRQVQTVSDCLIAAAYFSIPLELIYFVSRSHVFPFRWILFQFVAFIVLCGLSHLLTVFACKSGSFLLMLSLSVSKFLTALVSFATAITLLTLIPQLLRVKVRETFLRCKARDLDRRIEMMKMEEETGWQVRLLTQEIRKSLDRRVILSTAVSELARILGLQNCAVWMPNDDRTEMLLTHESAAPPGGGGQVSPIDDPDAVGVALNAGPVILPPDSLLGFASSGQGHRRGAAAAIRLPLLKASEAPAAEAPPAILVLVLPEDAPEWGEPELGIAAAVADQVAVALLHAGILEESQRMREKLEEQNQALQRARVQAMMAGRAKNSSQSVTSLCMRRPAHSIAGLLSLLQREALSPEQRLAADAMAKTAAVVCALVGDAMDNPPPGSRSLALDVRRFRLHAAVREAAAVLRLLCDRRRLAFSVQVDGAVPDLVYGDEKRLLQVILRLAGDLIADRPAGAVCFSVRAVSGDADPSQRWVPWKPAPHSGLAAVRFEIAATGSPSPRRISAAQQLSMCRKLVQLMDGEMRVAGDSAALVVRLRRREAEESSEQAARRGPPFKGLRALVVDGDEMNRAVAQRVLEKLGCRVSAVASGFLCLNLLGAAASAPFDLVLLATDVGDTDSFLLASQIRKFRSGNWPLVVAMAASSQDSVWERCLRAGMHGLVLKPLTLQTISDELRRVLRVS